MLGILIRHNTLGVQQPAVSVPLANHGSITHVMTMETDDVYLLWHFSLHFDSIPGLFIYS